MRNDLTAAGIADDNTLNRAQDRHCVGKFLSKLINAEFLEGHH